MSVLIAGKAILGALGRPLLLGVLCMVGGAAAGAWLTSTIKNGEIAQLKLDWIEQRLADATATHQAFNAAWERGDRLTRRLVTERRAATAIQEMYDDALTQATDGRACLGEPALRVLDRLPGLAVAGLPEAPGGSDRTHARRVASDTDIARWARDAGGAYAECVRRLDALIDWTESGAAE